MKKVSVVLVILFVSLVTGCVSGRSASVDAFAGPEGPDREVLWRAALDATSARFTIESAQHGTGVIKTHWLVGPLSKSAVKSNSVGREAGERALFHTVRRRATITVNTAASNPLEIVVQTERLIREHPDIVRGGTFSLGRRLEGDDKRVSTRWTEEGRDAPLEEKLREEITARYAKYERKAPR
mgnify:CR=1 FL=1